MVTVTIIIIFILIGLFTFRQFFKRKSANKTTNGKFTSKSFKLIGIILILLGLFLSFGITVYSLKENDNNGFYGFFISFGFIGYGIYCLLNGMKSKNDNL